MRLRITLDFERRRPDVEQYDDDDERVDFPAAQVDRAPSNDFEQAGMVGFCRNDGGKP